MAEMGRCADCRWWGAIEDEAGLGHCSMLGSFDQEVPIRLHRSPGSGEAIITGELFGCIFFEAKAEHDA